MQVLVVYASKYGSTKGIAERIPQTINDAGQQAAAVSASARDGQTATTPL